MAEVSKRRYRYVRGSSEQMAEKIRDYLTTADLLECKQDEIAALVGSPMSTIQHRLGQIGTSWQALKLEERRRRLDLIVKQSGKIDIEGAVLEVGFSWPATFFRFFKEVYGETFTDWRLRRQTF